MLKWIRKKAFEKSLTSTRLFRDYVRPYAYRRAGGDTEAVHEMALEALNEYEDVIQAHSYEFRVPELMVTIANRPVMAFGTAAGLDKNADAVESLSHIFGFQEVGTIVLNEREGNKRPRVAVDNQSENLYNAQGFPSKGLKYAKDKLEDYRLARAYGKGVILASICGIPPSPDKLDVAQNETEILTRELDIYVDGFVWNPFSPNTEALKALRTPETFEKYARLIKFNSMNKPALVKLGPCENDADKMDQWLELCRGWIRGGGDGFVAVNTYMVSKEQVPSSGWGYPSAGRSGRFLQKYRQRAITDLRTEFPHAFIIATGGIDSAYQAFLAFEAGADALEGYTPYTFHGFGLLKEMAYGVRGKFPQGLDEFRSKRKAKQIT